MVEENNCSMVPRFVMDRGGCGEGELCVGFSQLKQIVFCDGAYMVCTDFYLSGLDEEAA